MLGALALCLLGLAGGLATLIYCGADRLLNPARPKKRCTPDDCGVAGMDENVAYEAVSFVSSDGVTLRGWFFPLAQTAPVIVYCPGRGEGLTPFDFRYSVLFLNSGYQVLMFDWRGMGASDGRSSMGYREQLDLAAAVTFVRRRAPAARIGAMGTSLGAAVILLAAGRIPDIAAAAGECAFATFEGMVASGMCVTYGIPAVVARPLAWAIARLAAWQRGFRVQDADPVRAIHRISPRPVFVIHGEHDRHVPVASGYALYAAAGEPKSQWITPTAHTQGLEKLGTEYCQRLIRFFDSSLKTSPGRSLVLEAGCG